MNPATTGTKAVRLLHLGGPER